MLMTVSIMVSGAVNIKRRGRRAAPEFDGLRKVMDH